MKRRSSPAALGGVVMGVAVPASPEIPQIVSSTRAAGVASATAGDATANEASHRLAAAEARARDAEKARAEAEARAVAAERALAEQV